ncbi:MAG: T9SS type A sorting domain-containing protein, partial [candidate division Zixibacteria bacterium]|nr:T9SS type A sorting domain-containing protein [candidate division Zixibacteria bacterium]
GNYREPFITETEYFNNVGINLKRQSYSFSYGYNHTNDFILMRHVLNVTGNVDVNNDGNRVEQGVVVKNFTMVFNYDFDIPTGLDPNSNNINENVGGDDKAPTGFFVDIMPRAVPEDLIASGRSNRPPYGPRVYQGMATMFDEDDPGGAGVDNYIWSLIRQNFNPLHMGEGSLLVLEGNGTGALGDLNAEAARDIYGAPTVGLFQTHSWWESDWRGVYDWYSMSMSKYLKSYPGDAAISGLIAQPRDYSPNPDTFTAGQPLSQTTDVSTWTPKAEMAELGLKWGDPRNLTQAGNPAVASLGLVKGQYDNLTLFDLDGKMKDVVPDPYKGGDRKEITSTTGCDRNMIGWGPFTKSPGEDLTVWQVDLVGAGQDGMYDVFLRALDVWMQRKYNPANDTYYWDGSNDRIIPRYNPDGTVIKAGGVVQTETINLGRAANSGALFHPPPAPTLSVIETNSGTLVLAWLKNAETAVDPGTNAVDFSKYRVYRASGFIDQFPGVTVAHPIGYNSTIIPPNMGTTATPVTDVTDPLSASVKTTHPYARFIQEGLVIGADYNIGRVFDFVTGDVNKFAAPGFAGPYVQMAEFAPGSNPANTFSPPAKVKVPNPIEDVAARPPGFWGDTIETTPNAKQIVDANATNKATVAWSITFPTSQYGSKYGTGYEAIRSLEGITVDPRFAGKEGYLFEDRAVLIGFNYWYYVASVDNETATQLDFDSVLQNRTGSARTQKARNIVGLESFYTMNANGTDGQWHGTFPFRGRTAGPQVPGQAVVPVGTPYKLIPVPVVSLSTLFATPGDTVRMPVTLSNRGNLDIGGLQVDVGNGNPDDAHFVGFEDSTTAAGFTGLGSLTEGHIRLVFYSTSGASLSDSLYTLGVLKFAIPPTALVEAIPLYFTGLEVGDSTGAIINARSVNGTIQIGLRDDLNFDGRVSILDVIKEVRIIIGRDPTPVADTLDFKIADMNRDGEINVTDVVEQVKVILGIATKPTLAAAPSNAVVSLASVEAGSDGRSFVPITVDTRAAVMGLQMTFTFDPAKVTIGTPELAATRSGLAIDSHLTAGQLRIVVYGTTRSASVTGGTQTILRIPVIPRADARGDGFLTLTGAVLADASAQGIAVVYGQTSVNVTKWLTAPNAYVLKDAQPNPFNPSTTLAYEVPKQAHITLVVYNLLGQEVVRLVDETKAAGRYTVAWNGCNATGLAVATGIYVYRMSTSDGYVETKRMALLK